MDEDGGPSRKRARLGSVLAPLGGYNPQSEANLPNDLHSSPDGAQKEQHISFERANHSIKDTALANERVADVISLATPSNSQICFGMLSNIPIYSKKKAMPDIRWNGVEVSLKSTPTNFEVHAHEKIILGLLGDRDSKILQNLYDEEDLALQCTATASDSRNDSASGSPHRRKALSQQNTRELTLSVILYGPWDFSDDLDEFLGQHDMFLQLPVNCNRNVPYRNPQSLNRNNDDYLMTFDIQATIRSESIVLLPKSDPSSVLEVVSSIAESETPTTIKSKLYSHQKQALTFMRERESKPNSKVPENSSKLADLLHLEWHTSKLLYGCFDESLSPKHPEVVQGGILADSMGLGKSLSVLTLIASDVEIVSIEMPEKKTTLIVVPNTLIKTWEAEILVHFHPRSLQYHVHHGPKRSKVATRFSAFDIVLTSYDVVSADWRGLANGPKPLFLFQWSRIILDEAHEIRSSNTTRAKAVYALHGANKWVISGTPIQNRWEDLASLLYFLGVYPDSVSLKDIRAMLRNEQGQAHIKRLLAVLCLRRSKDKLGLPSRIDLLGSLEFEASEAACYNRMKEDAESCLQEELHQPDPTNFPNILTKINSLRQVCNLGSLYASMYRTQNKQSAHHAIDPNKLQQLLESILSMEPATCWRCGMDLGSVETTDQLSSDTTPIPQNGDVSLTMCGRLLCKECSRLIAGATVPQDIACGHVPSCRWFPVVPSQSHAVSPSPSTSYLPVKMRALQEDLMKLPGSDKNIVFSFWTSTLDAIEIALSRIKFSYVRIDGKMPIKQRQEELHSFTSSDSIRVILISLRCGAVGLNLTAANHVFLMEPQWNPMLEEQALDRVYRIGQSKDVTTTRYYINGTLEEGIRKQQEKKRNLAEQAHELSRQHKSWIKQAQDLLSCPG